MTKVEKQKLYEEVIFMDSTWIFIMGALIGMLWWYFENASIMKRWIGIMIWVSVFAWIYMAMAKESRKGFEVMESYRLWA